MKKYILEFKGNQFTREFCKEAGEYFDKFIEDDSKRTMFFRLGLKEQITVKVLDTESGECSEITEIKQIQSDGKIILVKPGLFRRVLSYFI